MRPRHRRRNADSHGDKDPRTGTRGRVGLTSTGQWSPGEHCAGSAGCRALPSTQRASVLAPATHETRAATGESDGSRVSPTPSSADAPHSAPGAVASQDYRGSAPESGRGTVGLPALPSAAWTLLQPGREADQVGRRLDRTEPEVLEEAEHAGPILVTEQHDDAGRVGA